MSVVNILKRIIPTSKDFTNLLWTCSGANKEILRECPKNEWNKYAGIGATVLFTGLLATVSAAFALYTVFQSFWASALFGLLWGAMIFNLDRFIVSTVKKEGKILRELKQATPRIILAVLIGIVISKPLELKIFEREINQKLAEQKDLLEMDCIIRASKQFAEIDSLKLENKRIISKLAEKEKLRNTLYAEYIAEAEGTAGTRIYGRGPVFLEKKREYEKIDTEFQELKSNTTAKEMGNNARIESLKTKYDIAVQNCSVQVQQFDGLKARIEALGNGPTNLFIMLLLISIEIAPVLTKLMASKSSYDDKLQNVEHKIKLQEQAEISMRNHQFQKDYTLSTEIDNAKLSAKIDERRHTIDLISRAQQKLVSEYIESWIKREQNNTTQNTHTNSPADVPDGEETKG